MQIGNLVILPWSKKNAVYRIVALLLVVAWVWWGIALVLEGGGRKGATAGGTTAPGTPAPRDRLTPCGAAAASNSVRRA